MKKDPGQIEREAKANGEAVAAPTPEGCFPDVGLSKRERIALELMGANTSGAVVAGGGNGGVPDAADLADYLYRNRTARAQAAVRDADALLEALEADA